MDRRNHANLGSPAPLIAPGQATDPDWLPAAIATLPSGADRGVLGLVASHLDEFARWPREGRLLWPGCTRMTKYHEFPDSVRRLARDCRVKLDARSNGPAVVAYLVAGGERPLRYGSRNAWTVHHAYSGRFPALGRSSTLHATHDPNHFTHSAGLVAIDPIADQLADEYPCFTWALRAEAYRRFSYDPDGVFRAGGSPGSSATF
jgi:hypothetical protein